MMIVQSPLTSGQRSHHQTLTNEFSSNFLEHKHTNLSLASAHVLVIEDSIALAQLLELELTDQGYRVSVAHDGISGLILARDSNPDLIILNNKLPDISGQEICRRLRSPQHHVPILMITGKVNVGDRLSALDAGANDFITKPFNFENLTNKIQFYLHQKATQNNLLTFAELTLNRATREVYKGRIPIRLTAKEFELLEYFMLHPEKVLYRDQMMQAVWSHSSIQESNVLDVYVRYLRLKLEIGNRKRLIHTVRSVGYILRDSTENR
jgi:DNA-binding response OmpR family regulator